MRFIIHLLRSFYGLGLGFMLFLGACHAPTKEINSSPSLAMPSLNSRQKLNMLFATEQYDSLIAYYKQYPIQVSMISQEDALAICQLGFCYYLKGDYNKADSCLAYRNDCLQDYWLGLVKYGKGEYDTAIGLFMSSLNCPKLTNDIFPIQPYLDVANTYSKMEDKQDSVLRYFHLALKFANNAPQIEKVYSNLADHYNELRQYDSAFFYFQKVPSTNTIPAHWRNYGLACNELSLQENIKPSLAKSYYELAKLYTRKDFNSAKENKDSLSMAIDYNNLGFFLKEHNELDSAMYYLQMARSYLRMISPDGHFQSFRSWDKIIRNYSGTAKTFQAKYKVTKNIKNADSAIYYFHLIPNAMTQMRKTMENENDKSLLTKLLYNVYEPALAAVCNYPTPDTHLQYACDFIEAGKSLGLLEEIQDKFASENGTIPLDSLRMKEQIQTQINAINHQLLNTNSTDLYKKRIALEKRQSLLLSHLQHNYPHYYALKYPNTDSKIADIQAKCKKNNAVFLDFFQGESAVYLLYITPQQKGLIQTKINGVQLAELVTDFRHSLDSIWQYPQVFKTTSHQLYQTLFATLDSTLSHSSLSYPIKATLVLDGYLHLVPFDALLSDTLQKHYLIEKYNFQHAYSAAMYMQGSDNENNKGKILAISPVFDSGFDAYYKQLHLLESALDSTGNMLQYMNKKYPITTLFRKEATVQNFQKQLNQYDFIHLATHAVADDRIPENSYIALAPNDKNDSMSKGYFMRDDIYATKMNVAIALLTACETGKGKIKKGEGVMSLARAFSYAGCRRIVMTLWSVDEFATMGITKSFYENLAKGESYADALYHAKLDAKYLSPDKWAAMVLIGEGEGHFPIKEKKASHLLYILLGALFLGGILSFGMRKNK